MSSDFTQEYGGRKRQGWPTLTTDPDPADAAFEALCLPDASPSPHTEGQAPIAKAQFEALLGELARLNAPVWSSATDRSARGWRSHKAGDEGRARPPEIGVPEWVASNVEPFRHAFISYDRKSAMVWNEGLEKLVCMSVNVQVSGGRGGQGAALLVAASRRGDPGAVLLIEACGWLLALPLVDIADVRPMHDRPPGRKLFVPSAWWGSGLRHIEQPVPYWVDLRKTVLIGAETVHGIHISAADPPGLLLAGARALAGSVRTADGRPALLMNVDALVAEANAPTGD